MENARISPESNGEAKRLPPAGKGRSSLLGWVRRKLRRIMNRKEKELEIYPLF